MALTQYQTERRLSFSYGAIIVLGLFTIVCMAIPWNHWKHVLDTCPNLDPRDNCGCILYGISTFTYFTGGPVAACGFIVYGTIPIVGFALVMALFHSLRVCINSIGKYEQDNSTTIERREGEVIVMTSRAQVNEKTDSVVYCWIPSAIFAAVFALYSLAVAAVLTDGYYKTCNQYRGELIKILRSTGSQVRAIHSRLGCQAIYDFMDYLQPDILDRHRGDFINTGASLQLAIVAAWFMVFTWIYVVVLTSMRARRDRDTLTCCGK